MFNSYFEIPALKVICHISSLACFAKELKAEIAMIVFALSQKTSLPRSIAYLS